MPVSEDLAKRRVPCMAAFISPFRIVNAPDSAPWAPTIDDVNKRRWEYAELHRLAGAVDVGMPSPYHMVVARDGAVGLPVLPPTKDIYSATEQFNRCFAQITSPLWEARVLAPARADRAAAGRLDQLTDSRTWTVATRHELLHQIGALTAAALSELAIARRTRNALAHRGQHPGESETRSAYASVLSLLEIACGDRPIPPKALALARRRA